MSVENLPLQELFTRLRKADLPLGIEEYLLVLHALQAGFGISDRKALKCLCHTLWIKSVDEARVFDYHFEQLIPRPPKSETSSQPLAALPEQSETQSDTPSPLSSSKLSTSDPPSPTTVSEMTLRIEDEVQVAQAMKQSASNEDEILSDRYISSDEYFPVTRRQMKQSWRYLSRPVREGLPTELDVEATVSEVGRRGILLEPVLVPQRINRAELLLLIDHGGSMVPFHMLSRRLVETVLRGGRLGKADIYYFHNYPGEYLYRDHAHQEYERIEELLNGPYSKQACVLIFSDAGAARGGYSLERIDLTEKFLKQFKQRFRYIAWLNPMPRSRWPGTTAGQVMQSIPMSDLSRRGLDDAISVLRGRPSHYKAQIS